MKPEPSIDPLAEDVLRQIRTTVPSASLGFPSTEELDRFRQHRHSQDRQRHERRIEEENRRFRRLKETALANIGKDRP